MHSSVNRFDFAEIKVVRLRGRLGMHAFVNLALAKLRYVSCGGRVGTSSSEMSFEEERSKYLIVLG